MRGVETRIQEIRHRIFREVARMAYHTEWPVDKRIEELPYKIIPGEVGNFRNDVFLERAIVGERLRLAMGLPYRSAAEHAPVSDNIEAADRPETYYTPPLINVIKFACNACHEKRVFVTDGCQGCLAHPCEEVCPKDAIKLDRTNGRSHINDDKCIKCGRCADVCSYKAIIIQERPCAAACGMDAISTDENGKADIDYDKCVSCGMCLVNCPFGAIADKSQIFQVIRAIQSGERVYAAVAPAFVGQFGPKVTPGKLRAAMKALGFADVFEVEKIEEDPEGVNDASMDGRNFAVAGGVAKSVVDVIHERYPDKEIKVANAEGLKECRKLLTMAKAGKYNGYLLEGMACPGGCVAGAGTMQPIKKSQASVNLYASKAKHKTSNETEHVKELDKLVD